MFTARQCKAGAVFVSYALVHGLLMSQECAEMMLAAGGIPMLRQLTLYPNINVRDLCKDAIEALDFAENPH